MLERDDSSVLLGFTPSPEQLAKYPHRFRLTYKVTLAEKTLRTEMAVTNEGHDNMQFTCALHTYFSVPSIESACVVGLEETSYLDSLQNRVLCPATHDRITFSAEFDRIYVDTPGDIEVRADGQPSVMLRKSETLPDAVVWNPWIAKVLIHVHYSTSSMQLYSLTYKHRRKPWPTLVTMNINGCCA